MEADQQKLSHHLLKCLPGRKDKMAVEEEGEEEEAVGEEVVEGGEEGVAGEEGAGVEEEGAAGEEGVGAEEEEGAIGGEGAVFKGGVITVGEEDTVDEEDMGSLTVEGEEDTDNINVNNTNSIIYFKCRINYSWLHSMSSEAHKRPY